ncbi:MAG: acyl-CoA dehydrogenase family protein [Solirubrobacteraceae bacterium]
MIVHTGRRTTPGTLSPSGIADLRQEVRDWLVDRPGGRCDSWLRGFDPSFSQELGRRGWLGLSVPGEHGGHGAGAVARYVVTEELLAAGAPVAYHWFADRQIAPTLLAHGSAQLQRELLPAICRGELCFCIGISEPDAGSDVAAISTRAERTTSGWRINGQKVWTTGAMHAQYCYVVVRTSREEKRHAGLSELVVPMDRAGISVRPIEDMAGESHFAELFFEDVEVEDWRLVGTAGEGFRQIVEQLDYERSGPERFLSTMPLLDALVEQLHRHGADSWLIPLGDLTARLAGLRAMALGVAEAIDQRPPARRSGARAALVKDMGAEFEQDIVTLALSVSEVLGPDCGEELRARLREGLLYQPTFTLRGGTVEVLRDVVAQRMLGLKRSR